MRRCALSTRTIAPTTTTMNVVRIAITISDICPRWTCWRDCQTAVGKPATMPAKMISEMPFPIPRSVICSPSHMTKAVPVVRVRTASITNGIFPMSRRTRGRPLGAVVDHSQRAMPLPWTTERTTVPYRVYCVIFRRPSSPSFESFSRNGQTTVRSCRMIDAVM